MAYIECECAFVQCEEEYLYQHNVNAVAQDGVICYVTCSLFCTRCSPSAQTQTKHDSLNATC